MLTAAKKETFSASSGPCVFFPLAASGVYPKTRVWGSKPENVHCSSAIGPLKIELCWGCEECSEKTAVGSGVSFKYDPFGRRIYKSSSAGTSIYAYAGHDLIEEVNSSGSVVSRYTQGPEIDEPLAMLRSSTTSYYEQDGLGSVTSLSNGAGALAQTYTLDSFGNQTASSGSLTNPFHYTGRELDSETGLYFYRNRYYDPVAGRFLGEYLLRFWSGSNFYSYVHNNPVRFLDPFGLQEKKKKEKDPDATGDWIPGVHWIKCKIWGYYCLQVVFQKKQEELAHPSPLSDDDQSRGSGDAGKRQIEICVAGDDNCKKYLKNCGDDILGGVKDGMFPK